jgi:hypothetical protein
VKAAAHAAALALLLLAQALRADSAPARDARADVELLLESGLRSAERELREHGGLRPFALVMASDGRVSRLAPVPRRDQAADAVLQDLFAALRTRAQAGSLQAAAVFSDVRIALPGGVETEALHAAWEHQGGTCANVYIPYRRASDGALTLEPRIVNRRPQASVFQSCAGGAASSSRSAATSRR